MPFCRETRVSKNLDIVVLQCTMYISMVVTHWQGGRISIKDCRRCGHGIEKLRADSHDHATLTRAHCSTVTHYDDVNM